MSKTKASGSKALQVCPECGKTFTPKVYNQKYCSHACAYNGQIRADKKRKTTNKIQVYRITALQYCCMNPYDGKLLYFDGLHAVGRDLPGHKVDFALGF